MALLKALGRLNRLPGFPFAMPNGRIEADTTRNDVNVVMLSIGVADYDVLVI
jgi:hypothetical protein